MPIHPTACIASSARIGSDVTIGPYVCIEDDVVVGDGCVLGPHACLLQYTRLGNNCRVHAGTALGDLPQDRKFQGEASYLEIGPDCIFREGVTVHRGTQPGSITRIGQGCLLMANSHVAHNVTLGDNVIMCNGALLAGHVEVGDQAFISANAMVHQFARVGRLSMLAGGTLAQMDVPPFCITPRPAHQHGDDAERHRHAAGRHGPGGSPDAEAGLPHPVPIGPDRSEGR